MVFGQKRFVAVKTGKWGAKDSKPQTNEGRRRRTFWCRKMRFVGRLFCCGAHEVANI